MASCLLWLFSFCLQVLSDQETREVYDRYGEEGLKEGGRGRGASSDTFASFFGDFFGGGFEDHRQRDTPKGGNVVMTLFVTLEELYAGEFVQITRKKPVYKPSSGTRRCNCRQEMITKSLGPGRFQMMQHEVCDECPNLEISSETRNLEVEIEIGMRDGQEQRFVAEGEPHIDGDPGDLIVRIRTQPHTTFERRGDDLYTNITISLTDALTGFEMELPHLDGHKVSIKRDKITWPGSKMRKPNEGMPNYENNNKFGTLYITFDVDFPKGELNEDQKKLIKEIFNEGNKIRSYNGLRGY